MVNWEDQPGSEFVVVFLAQGAAKPSYACKIRVKRCWEHKRTQTSALAQFYMLTVMTDVRRRLTV